MTYPTLPTRETIKIGIVLKQTAQSKHITQTEIGKMCGFNVSNSACYKVSSIFNGCFSMKRTKSLDDVKKICDFLKIDYGNALKGKCKSLKISDEKQMPLFIQTNDNAVPKSLNNKEDNIEICKKRLHEYQLHLQWIERQIQIRQEQIDNFLLSKNLILEKIKVLGVLVNGNN